MEWNRDLLEEILAPGISTFVRADIPDLPGQFAQADHWLANHFLNSALRSRFKDGHRQVVVAFLRRASSALSGYHSARSQTLEYLTGLQPLNPKIRAYYSAVSAWEHVALDIQICMDLFRWINLRVGAFEKNDGSKEQRLYTIGNQVKHLASCVDSGQCEREALPLWLTTAGLQSFQVSVTFDEVAAVLSSLCTLADELQDPRSFAAPQAGEAAAT